VVFEASPDKLIRDTAEFGWDLDRLQREKKLQSSLRVRTYSIKNCGRRIVYCLRRRPTSSAQRIFIDGVGMLDQISSAGSTEPLIYRDLLHQLIETLSRENLTALLSLELGTHSQSLAIVDAADFLSDTVIQLNRDRRNRRSHRSIEIIKVEASTSRAGNTPFGSLRIRVWRCSAAFRPQIVLMQRSPPPARKRSLIGVDAVDTLIGGGIFDGSTTMVVGVSGVGKTVLGTQLLREGALTQEKRGLMVSLDEHRRRSSVMPKPSG